MTPIKGFAKGETIYIVSRWFMSFALPDKQQAPKHVSIFLDGKKGTFRTSQTVIQKKRKSSAPDQGKQSFSKTTSRV